MVQWGACRRVFISQHGENNSQLSSNTVEKDGDEEAMVADSHLIKDSQKSKRLCSVPRQEPNAVRSEKLWDSCHRVFINQQGENNQQPPSSSVKEDDDSDRDDETITAEPLVPEERQKRKRTCPIQFQEMDTARYQKQRQSRHCNNNKKNKVKSSINRWSEDRYKLAEESMLEILKAEGAVFGNAITRPALRSAARKRIGDTGLLDHLLKHIDGKVAPGGAERFRRWHNTNGVMEYWLEGADMVDIRREAGVQDPFWVPTTSFEPGDLSHDPIIAQELKLLKAEMAKMKKDVQNLVSKKREEVQPSTTNQRPKLNSSLLQLQETRKELENWKAKTEKQLTEISNSLNSMQEMHEELVEWKAKIEQQLTETSNSLSVVQVSNQCATFSPSASGEWENWFGSNELGNIPVDFPNWLENGDLVDMVPEEIVPDPYKAPPSEEKPSNILVKIEPKTTGQDPCQASPPGKKLPSDNLVDIEREATVQQLYLAPPPVEKPHDARFNIEPKALGLDLYQGPSTWKRPSNNPSVDPSCTRELELLKEELAAVKRDVQDLEPNKPEEDSVDSTPNSSSCTDLDLDNSLLLMQEMQKELVKWKAKIEQQLAGISVTLNGMHSKLVPKVETVE